MTNCFKKASANAVLYALVAGSSWICYCQEPAPNPGEPVSRQVSLSLELYRPIVKSGEPVSVFVTLKDISPSTITVLWMAADQIYDFVVENSRHERLSPIHAVRMPIGSAATIAISQNADTTDIVNVNDLYDFSSPGTYRIQATRKFAPMWRILGSVVSNWVQVTVQSESEYREPERKRSQSLGLYVRREREEFHVGERVLVEMGLKNLTSRPVPVDHSGSDRDYSLKVSNEQGETPPLTREAIRLRETMLHGFARTANELKPGEQILSVIDAASVYEFDAPGFYWIEISRTVPGQKGSEREEVVSNRFRIQVIR